jgi:tetratricopeptide (TPR) repeat protein
VSPKATHHDQKAPMGKSKIIGLIIVVFVLAVALNPFVWILCGSSHFRGKVIEQLVYKALVSKITYGITSEKEKAIRLFDYIDMHIFHKERLDLTPIDVNFLTYLLAGTGDCNHQAHTLMNLAQKANIRARVLFLRGYDKVSHHSVCELQLDGTFRIFDPDYGYVFYINGEIATFSDIQKRQHKISCEKLDSLAFFHTDVTGNNYFRLFRPTYRFIIANTNFKIHLGRMLRSGVIDLYYDIFGDHFLIRLQDLYFKIAPIEPLLQARLEHLSFRFHSALEDYNTIINKTHNSFLKSECLFYKGQLLWDMKRYQKCISVFEHLLHLLPETRWREEIYFYLGDAYQNLKRFEQARWYYSQITDSHTTPASIRLMKLIKRSTKA